MKRLLILFLAACASLQAAQSIRDLSLTGLLNRLRDGSILTVQDGAEIIIASGGKLTVLNGAIVTGITGEVGTTYTFTAADFNLSGTTVSIDYTNAQKASALVPGFMLAADKAKLDGIAANATANSSDAQLRDRSTHTGTQAISTISGLQAALDAGATFASLIAVNGSGPNSGTGRVHWSQLEGVPAGFADETDDGAGGGSITFSLPLRKTGDDVSIDAATTSAPGSMSSADKSKLDGIASGATAGATWDSNITGQPTVIGQAEAEAGVATTQRIWTSQRVAQAIAAQAAATGHSHSNATTGAAGFMSAADKTKLDGVAAGATANDTDANLRARSSHTGQQPMSTISDAGNSATRDVGITAGTVAAGDDSRITGAVQTTSIDTAAERSTLGFKTTTHGGLDERQDHGTMGATETFDLANANVHVGTLDANLTPTLTGFTNGKFCVMLLGLLQNGTGGWTITWPAAVVSAPAVAMAADTITWVSLWSIDGGTTIYASSTSDGGDVSSNTSTAIDGELALFSGTEGKTIKRATTTGLLKATSGVLAPAVANTDYVAPGGNIGAGTANTPSAADNSTKIATTAFVAGEIDTAIDDTALAGSWNGDASKTATRNALHDAFVAIDADLDGKVDSLDGVTTAGLLSVNSSGVPGQGRTITGTSGRISVTNGDGQSGNPTLDIGPDVVTKAANIQRLSLTLDTIADGLSYTITRLPAAFTVTRITGLHEGAGLSSPSIVATFKHGTNRTSGTTIEAVTVTSSTTGTEDDGTLSDATIPANSFVWVELSSKSGTTAHLFVEIWGTYD